MGERWEKHGKNDRPTNIIYYKISLASLGKRCMGLTPMECFMQNKHLAQVKMIGYEKNNTTTNLI